MKWQLREDWWENGEVAKIFWYSLQSFSEFKKDRTLFLTLPSWWFPLQWGLVWMCEGNLKQQSEPRSCLTLKQNLSVFCRIKGIKKYLVKQNMEFMISILMANHDKYLWYCTPAPLPSIRDTKEIRDLLSITSFGLYVILFDKVEYKKSYSHTNLILWYFTVCMQLNV